MTDKELRRLRRSDLLEMLIEAERKNEALMEKNERLSAECETREIKLANAGSIAEAALALNDIFETAQKAATQYLESVKKMELEQREAAAEIQAEAQSQADRILAQARDECLQMELQNREHCGSVLKEARQSAEEEWKRIEDSLEKYYEAHQGLKELMDLNGINFASGIDEKVREIHGQ